MRKRIFGFSILLLMTLFLRSQSYPTQIVKFDENDGFKSGNYIGDVKSDSEGFIWIVDFNQVNRYDGISFKTIKSGKVNHNALLRFVEGQNGQKMVLDYSGLFYYIEEDTLRPYEYNNELKELKIGSIYTDVFLDKESRLHISYNKTGYIILDQGKISRPLDSLAKSILGEIIILKDDGSTFVSFNNEKKRLAQKIFVLNENLVVLDSIKINKKKYNYPSAKTKWKNGRMYYSNGFGNYYEINKSGNIKELQFDYPIVKLLLDNNENLWLSTMENGLFCFKKGNPKNKKVYFSKTTSILSEQDLEGGLWVYSYEEGLILLPYPNYEFLNKSLHPSFLNKVSSLAFDKEDLLITQSGKTIIKYNQITQTIDSIKTPISSNRSVKSIFKDSINDVLWISQRGKLYYQKNNKWTSFQTSKIPGFSSRSNVKIIGYDSYSNCNIAICNNRYFLFRDTTIKYISPEFKDQLNTICKIFNKTYVSTNSGVFLQEGESIKSLADEFPPLKEIVHSITEFNGRIFFAIKNRSLYSLHNDSLELFRFNSIPIENALVFKTSNDSIWFFANQGSFLLNGNGSVSAFERLPKMISSSIISNKCGIFWTSLKKGVFYSPFEAIKKMKLRPVHLKLNSVKINGTKEEVSSKPFQVSYNKGFVQISYQSITYRDWPVTYRYIMTGLNSEWILTSEKSVQFTTLPIGVYNFELQAKMGDQLWSEPIRLKFEVLPPVWRKWWFILIIIITIFTLVYFIISFRFKTIKREKDLIIDKLKAEQRALRAQMDPHFVFNVVASAQYLVMKEENEKAVEFLNMFSKLMRGILDHSNSNQISLEREIKFLEDYINLEHFRLEKRFNYKIQYEGIKNNLQLQVPPFIIQPFIENAIHHGLKNKDGEKSLYLEFKIEKEFLIVEVIDSGIGRENAGKFISEEKRKRKSHGIRIIIERLQLHNNRRTDNITYRNPKLGGTHVTIKIKLN